MEQLTLFNIEPSSQAVEKAGKQENNTSKEKKAEPDKNTIVFTNDAVAVKLKQVNMPASEERKKVAYEPKEVAFKNKRGRISLEEMDAQIDLVEVPDDAILFQKQYYSISTVAQWFHVNISLLRFWENEFDILQPRKTKKGDRLFRPEDVKNLQLIYFLLRQKKFTIEGAKNYLQTNYKTANAQMQIAKSLSEIRNFLLELKAVLE
jgi:DNA-binding transcriptional MerR regulator